MSNYPHFYLALFHISRFDRGVSKEIAKTKRGKNEQTPADWYETPLYYDIIYDADTRKEGRFLEAIAKKFSISKSTSKILEPACGSGRLVRELARRKWEVQGFDLNPKMLEFCRARCNRLQFKPTLWIGDMKKFSPSKNERVDLIHCLINTFRYLLSEGEARTFFESVQRALRPGGVFVLGLHLTDYSRRNCEHERWVMQRKKARVVCNTRTWPPNRRQRTENLRTRLKVTEGGKVWNQETLWTYRTYSLPELMKTIAQAAPQLKLKGLYDFNYDLNQSQEVQTAANDVILILQKKS